MLLDLVTLLLGMCPEEISRDSDTYMTCSVLLMSQKL